jgi:hypothetical protein
VAPTDWAAKRKLQAERAAWLRAEKAGLRLPEEANAAETPTAVPPAPSLKEPKRPAAKGPRPMARALPAASISASEIALAVVCAASEASEAHDAADEAACSPGEAPRAVDVSELVEEEAATGREEEEAATGREEEEATEREEDAEEEAPLEEVEAAPLEEAEAASGESEAAEAAASSGESEAAVPLETMTKRAELLRQLIPAVVDSATAWLTSPVATSRAAETTRRTARAADAEAHGLVTAEPATGEAQLKDGGAEARHQDGGGDAKEGSAPWPEWSVARGGLPSCLVRAKATNKPALLSENEAEELAELRLLLGRPPRVPQAFAGGPPPHATAQAS